MTTEQQPGGAHHCHDENESVPAADSCGSGRIRPRRTEQEVVRLLSAGSRPMEPDRVLHSFMFF